MSQEKEILIVRSLTSSDLGLFAAHRAGATSKQRAININAREARAMLSPEAFAAGGTYLDVICSFGGYSDRSKRHFGKVGKNWRLGGNKIEGQAFDQIDCKDFMVMRTMAGNDGSAPVSVTFIARSANPSGQAKLATFFADRLRQSMVSVLEGDPAFGELAAYCPPPPRPVTAAPSKPKRNVPIAAPPAPIAPMPAQRSKAIVPEKKSIQEKIRSPHLMEQMLKVSSDLSAPAQLNFMDTVGQLADQLRKVLLATGGIIKIERDHARLWADVKGKKIGFVDGGMANLSMLGSAPIAVRVGGYIVTPGDRSDEREQFITLKKLIAELYADPDGSVYSGSFPDPGALRDAARISIEAAGAVRMLQVQPDISWLFLHGALVNPVSRYTDVMQDEQVRFAFPNFSSSALSELLPGEEGRTGRDANFINVHLKQLQLLQQSKAIVCGVVERESSTTSVLNAILNSLENHEIESLLPMPAEAWKRWFRSSIDPKDDGEGEGQRITDPLLFRCILEPGEALRPVVIDRNEDRRRPKAWRSEIGEYPRPIVSFIQPTEWNAPVRLEMFESNADRFRETASLLLHCSLLLPKYAFPVGLDIVDKFAKIPDWMSRPVNTNTAVQALKMAMDKGDTRLFDALRRMLCGSQREWLLRPGPLR